MSSGKLGHGTRTRVTAPRRVEALSDKPVVRVASYNEHSAAICERMSAESEAETFIAQVRRNETEF